MSETTVVDAQGNTSATTYLNDPQNPTGYTKAVEEHTDTNGDGMAEAHRGYVLGLQVIAQASGADLYYLVTDGHGSTRMLLDGSGQTVTSAGKAQVYSYDAYDKILDTSLVPLTNWLFGGKDLGAAGGRGLGPAAEFPYRGRPRKAAAGTAFGFLTGVLLRAAAIATGPVRCDG